MSRHWHFETDPPVTSPPGAGLWSDTPGIIEFRAPTDTRSFAPRPPAHPCSDGLGKPPLFLDFEASSLSPQSWPVEIGYAWITGDRVETHASLIEPRADWALSDWSTRAEDIHGLALTEVLAGRPADIIAAETDIFAQYTVISDNPAREQVWLDRLRAGRDPRIEVLPLRKTVAARLSDRATDDFALRLLRAPAPHRAGPDAARLAHAWLNAARDYGRAA